MDNGKQQCEESYVKRCPSHLLIGQKKPNKDYVILKNCLVSVHKQNHKQTKQLHQPDLLVANIANIVSQPLVVSAVSIVVLEDCQFSKVHRWVYLQGIRPVQCGQKYTQRHITHANTYSEKCTHL